MIHKLFVKYIFSQYSRSDGVWYTKRVVHSVLCSGDETDSEEEEETTDDDSVDESGESESDDSESDEHSDDQSSVEEQTAVSKVMLCFSVQNVQGKNVQDNRI